VLEIARALREQIDWPAVRERTCESPFARAFFTLVEALGIVWTAEPRRLRPFERAGGVRAAPGRPADASAS
jgi:hypothetical protein